MCFMAWNVWMTAISGRSVKVAIPAVNPPRLRSEESIRCLNKQANKLVSPMRRSETSNFLMIVLILVVIAMGGLVEIVPLFFQKSTTTAGTVKG